MTKGNNFHRYRMDVKTRDVITCYARVRYCFKRIRNTNFLLGFRLKRNRPRIFPWKGVGREKGIVTQTGRGVPLFFRW